MQQKNFRICVFINSKKYVGGMILLSILMKKVEMLISIILLMCSILYFYPLNVIFVLKKKFYYCEKL